jgi:hypothetical protein
MNGPPFVRSLWTGTRPRFPLSGAVVRRNENEPRGGCRCFLNLAIPAKTALSS